MEPLFLKPNNVGHRRPQSETVLGGPRAVKYTVASATDYLPAHETIFQLVKAELGDQLSGNVLDICGGPAWLSIALAKSYPQIRIVNLDGSDEILREAAISLESVAYGNLKKIGRQIRLCNQKLPFPDDHVLRGGRCGCSSPWEKFDVVLCINAMHEIGFDTLIDTIRLTAKPFAPVLIVDIARTTSEHDLAVGTVRKGNPDSEPEAVNMHAESILASYSPTWLRLAFNSEDIANEFDVDIRECEFGGSGRVVIAGRYLGSQGGCERNTQNVVKSSRAGEFLSLRDFGFPVGWEFFEDYRAKVINVPVSELLEAGPNIATHLASLGNTPQIGRRKRGG